jgi:hypothetical protein
VLARIVENEILVSVVCLMQRLVDKTLGDFIIYPLSIIPGRC